MDKSFELLDQLRTSLEVGEYIEIITEATLLEFLDRKDNTSRIDSILRTSNHSGDELEHVLRYIEIEYPFFQNVFKQFQSIQKLSTAELSRFLFKFKSIITEIEDISSWYESFIEHYVSSVGRLGNGNNTPTAINDLAIKLLSPIDGTFHDGMSGFGGSLKYAADFAKQNKSTLKLFGQELSSQAWAVSKIRLFLAGYKEAEIHKGDIFLEPHFITDSRIQKFDYIFIDPPFGLEMKQSSMLENDPYNRFLYGIPTRRSGELATISHVISSLDERGEAVVVVPLGTLFRSGPEGRIRENIVSLDYIEAVITLPSGLYDNTSIPSNLIYFNKNKKISKKNFITFINAADDYLEVQRGKKTLEQTTIDLIVNTVKNPTNIPQFSKVVPLTEIENGNLSPHRYVTTSSMETKAFGTVNFSLERLKNIDTIPLEEVSTFFRGFNVSAKDESPEGDYKVVRISDVQDGQLLVKNVARYNITNNAKLELYKLLRGDVIVSIRGQAIKVAIVSVDDENLLLSQNFMGIRCGKRLNASYLKMYLESPVGQFILSKSLTGTAVPTLNKKDLMELKIPILTIEEQELIVSQFIEKEQNALQTIKELQQQLLDSKLEVYKRMGINDMFTITN